MAMTHAWHDIVHDMRDEMHDLVAIGRVDAARQAYLGLWATFVAVPLLFGLDKLLQVTNASWEGYLANWANNIIPGNASDAMYWLGAVEVVLAVLVAFAPRVGGDLFGLWMLLMAISLFSIGGLPELAIGAIALGICSVAMARMSTAYHHTEG
jgi:hypothetical protein